MSDKWIVTFECSDWNSLSNLIAASKDRRIKQIGDIKRVSDDNRRASPRKRRGQSTDGETQRDKMRKYIVTLAKGTKITLEDGKTWFTRQGFNPNSASGVMSALQREENLLLRTEQLGVYTVA